MPFDKIDIESITEERRKSVAKSIRTASGEERLEMRFTSVYLRWPLPITVPSLVTVNL
jgi:hypothetical protein